MNYNEALEYIHNIPKFRRPLGNANLSRLLAALGDPQDKLKFIHIAGTNGKGSTAAIIAEILKESGFKTGLFTSPFIETFNERVRINGECIGDGELAVYTERVKRAMEENHAEVSEFAFVTALAFLYFYEKQCGYVVLEVGMGGRLDATNVIKRSEVSVICEIGLDHTQYLGETIEEIAREKCGIMRNGGAVAAYPNGAADDIVRDCADKAGASVTFADTAIPAEDGFIYKERKYPLSLKGAYQPQNAAVALEAIGILREKGADIPDAAVINGLRGVKWAARFEYVADNVIIDGAHNIDGIKTLKKSLLGLKRDIVLVTAMMEDKAYDECIREIAPAAKTVVATEIDIPRCVSARKIAEIAESMNIAAIVNTNTADAVKTATEIADGGIVCVCGSLYLAGEVKKIFREIEK